LKKTPKNRNNLTSESAKADEDDEAALSWAVASSCIISAMDISKARCIRASSSSSSVAPEPPNGATTTAADDEEEDEEEESNADYERNKS